MRRHILICTSAVLLGGCAGVTVPGSDGFRVTEARRLIRKGDDAGARKTLAVVAGRKGGAPAPTAEALFHLGLLYVRDDEPVKARQTFERLSKEYPQTEWGVHAATLAELSSSASGADDLRRQLKNLRESNASLSRDNKELRLNLEKLKSLDLQLEQKVR